MRSLWICATPRAILALKMRVTEQQVAEITRSIGVLEVTHRQQEIQLAHYLALTGESDSKDIPAPGTELIEKCWVGVVASYLLS